MSSIAEDTVSCLNALETLATTLPTAPEEYRAEMSVEKVIDERDRLKIWAGSLGALQMGTKALTFRLRESPIMETNVKKLLQRLVDVLRGCLEITAGGRAPLETNRTFNLSRDSKYSSDSDSDSDSDNDSPRTELGQQMIAITSVLSDLYKLAFKIRNRATRPMSHKPAMYDETIQVDDNTRVSVFDSYEKYDRKFVEDSLSELRKHLKVEPYQHSTNRTSQERPRYTDALPERLAKITTTRRRILRYWQRHSEKLANVDEEGNEEITRLQEAVNRDWRNVTSGSERPTMTGTEATTYDPVYDSTPDTVSVISFASTAFDMEGNTIEIPPITSSLLQLPAFVCPYCKILIPSREGTGRAWKNHVLTDLMPYICTYTDCPDEMRMYGSRHDWIEHEKAAHLKEWRCFNHTDTAFKSPSELRRHLEVEHGTSVSQSQVQTLVDLGERNSSDARTMCPICFIQGPFSKGLTNHIAFHLEKFALFSIKGRFFETQEESDEDDDSKVVHGLGSSTASDNSEMSFVVDVDQSGDFDTLQSVNLTASISNTELDRPKNSRLLHSPLPISNTETRDTDPLAFVFQIHEIEESPGMPSRIDKFGRWIPSTDPGANIRAGGGISETYWYCDGQQIYQIPGLLSGLSKYSTHSVYFSAGYGFQILNGDTTTGTESESWMPLRFDHNETDYSSFLTNAGKNPQLRLERPDQLWPRMLLPDIYHAPVQTEVSGYGGLNGEMGVFLALIALSMPQKSLPLTLPTMYTEGSWNIHGHRFPRTSRRGVVVEVWASDFLTLRRMENGEFGKYYN